jgi:hypothetical protein
LSHVVHVWEQPAGQPLPADGAGVWALLGRLRGRQDAARSPRFAELSRQMGELFPVTAGAGGDADLWDPADLDDPDGGVVRAVGLRPGERHGEVHSLLAMRAVALGLNMADEEADHLYLADGRILSSSPGAHCTPAFATYFAGDHAGAWERFLALGAEGNPVAQYNMASMVMRGEVGRRNGALAHALLVMGGQDAEAARLRRHLKPETLAAADALLRRLRQPGQFVALVQRVLAPAPPRARPERAPATLVRQAPALASMPPAAESVLPAPPPPPAARARRRDRPRAVREAPSGGAGPLWALAAGSAGLPLMRILEGSVGSGLARALFVVLAVVGAAGVWRAARELQWRTKTTLGLSLLSLLPLAGIVVCGGIALRLMRHRAS